MLIENIQKTLSEAEYIFSSENTVENNECCLYMLLLDHPFFIKQIKEIRTRLGIPIGGYKDYGKTGFRWEHSRQNNKKLLWSEVEDMVSKFKIQDIYIDIGDVKFFAMNYIVSKELIKDLLPQNIYSENEKLLPKRTRKLKPAVKIIKASIDLEANKYIFTPGRTYLEIFPKTTRRDIDLAFKKITEKKKNNLPYNVPKPSIIARNIWNLAQKRTKNKDIVQIINTTYDKKFTYEEILIYKKRYADALRKLRTF